MVSRLHLQSKMNYLKKPSRLKKLCMLCVFASGLALLVLLVLGHNSVYDDVRHFWIGQERARPVNEFHNYQYYYPDTVQGQIPEPLQGLITSFDELKGRHSDYLAPKCQSSDPALQWNTSSRFDYLGPFDYLPDYKNPCWRNNNETQGKLRCIPYFYFIGAPKAGSTDLFWRLASHPQVNSGRAKETRWFEQHRLETKGMGSFKSYLQHYDAATHRVEGAVRPGTKYHHQVIGDGSPTTYFRTYSWQKIPGNEGCSEPRVTAISHIHHLYPKAKLIMVLRNPVTRLFSWYLYNTPRHGGNETVEQFHEWFLLAKAYWEDCLRHNSFRYCLYDRGMETTSKSNMTSAFVANIYSRYLLDVLKTFPREQLFVVQLEDYSVNKVARLTEIMEYLQLDPLRKEVMEAIAAKKQMNKGSYYKKIGPMMEKTKKLLEEFYAPYNRELAAILNDNRFLWLD